MKNESRISVRTLTAMALLIAMSIVFSRVLSISTGFVRFNLGSLPVLLAGILFGPWAGFVVGMVADIIGGVLAGYAINPLITLGAASIGLVGGLGWQKLFHLRTYYLCHADFEHQQIADIRMEECPPPALAG